MKAMKDLPDYETTEVLVPDPAPKPPAIHVKTAEYDVGVSTGTVVVGAVLLVSLVALIASLDRR